MTEANIKYFNIVKQETNKVYYIFIFKRKVLFRTDNLQRFSSENLRWLTVKGRKYGVIGNEPKTQIINFLKQQQFGEIGFLSGISDMIKRLISRVKHFCVGMTDPHTFPLVMDILSLFTTLTCNTLVSWTPAFILANLVRFWSLYIRTDIIFKCESEAFLAAAATMFLPPSLQEYVKRINLFTSKKLFDCPSMFLDLIGCVSGFLLECVSSLTFVPEFIIDFLKRFLSIGTRHKYLSEMANLIGAWSTNKRLILTDTWRLKVKTTFDELSKDDLFKEFIKSNSQAQCQYRDFLRLYKSIINYENCSRAEPVCIVFDGPPGLFKSIFVTQLLKYMGLTSYIHATKSIDDGKDFYDNYNNEDVFVMDDVGQQGVSQWRSIINFVSCVKLPLDCASADLKDTKFFSSSFIFLTTNNFINLQGSLTKTDCISDIHALWRRCHVINFHAAQREPGGTVVTGNLLYQRWDVISNKWVHTFIDNKPFKHIISIVNRPQVISWLAYMAKRLRKHYDGVKTITDLTPDDIEYIATLEAEFERAENPVEEREDYESAHGDDNAPEFDFLDMSELLIINFIIFYFKHYVTSTLGFLFDIACDGSDVFKKVTLLGGVGVLFYNLISFFLRKRSINPDTEDEIIIYDPKKMIVDKWRSVLHSAPTILMKTSESLIVTPAAGAPSNVEAIKNRMGIVELPIYKGGEFGHAYCQALTSGHFLLVVGHSIEDQIDSPTILNFYVDPDSLLNNNPLLNNIPYSVAYSNKSLDLCILQLPIDSIAPFKSCAHFFNIKDSKDSVLHPFFVNCFGEINLSSTIKIPNETVYYQTTQRRRGLVAGTYFEYQLSAPGLCGSLVVDGKNGILGMHVSGDGERGNAVILSAAEKQRIFKILNNDKHLVLDSDPIQIGDFSKIKPVANFSGGIYPSTIQQHVPSKTSYVESPLHGYKNPTKFPANLSVRGPKTVKVMADKSYKVIPPIPKDTIEFASKCIDSFLCDFDVLSEEEIVSGGEFLSSINKDSVNGYGFEKEKEKYIDFENKCFKPEFRQIVTDLENKIKLGQAKISDCLYYETLKDELRLEPKVDKPRSFRVCPLAIVVLTKKYLGNLFKHLIKHKWFNQVMIGVNPYKDWERIYETIITNALHIFDGDIAVFDGSQPSQIQDMVGDKVKSHFIGADPEILAFLIELTIRSIILTLNEIRTSTHSTPSGSWITGVFNSLNNRGFTACLYYNETIAAGMKPTVSEFLKIRDFVCGDDKLCSVDATLASRVNALTMKKFFRSIGMDFTKGDKSEITEPGMSISDVSFLKRKFEFHHQLGKIVGPLSMETLDNSIQWMDGRKDVNIVMDGKLAAFQREIYLHQHTYKTSLEKLKQFCLERSVNFVELPIPYLFNLFKNDADEAFILYKRDFNKNYDNF